MKCTTTVGSQRVLDIYFLFVHFLSFRLSLRFIVSIGFRDSCILPHLHVGGFSEVASWCRCVSFQKEQTGAVCNFKQVSIIQELLGEDLVQHLQKRQLIVDHRYRNSFSNASTRRLMKTRRKIANGQTASRWSPISSASTGPASPSPSIQSVE